MDDPSMPEEGNNPFRELYRWQDEISDELSNHMHCLEEAERAAGRGEREASKIAKRKFGSRFCVVAQLWFDLTWRLTMKKRDVLLVASTMMLGGVVVGWIAWSSASESQRLSQMVLKQIEELRLSQAQPATDRPVEAGLIPNKQTVDKVATLIEHAHADLKRTMSKLTEDTVRFRAQNPDIIFLEETGLDPYAQEYLSLHRTLSDMDVQRKRLEVMLEQATTVREAGGSALVIYQMLANQSDGSLTMNESHSADPESSLEIQLGVLQEELKSLNAQHVSLSKTAQLLKQKSRLLQGALSEHRVLESNRSAVHTLMEAYREKLQEFDLINAI